MKKIIALLLVIASVTTLAACDGKDDGTTDPADPEVFQSEMAAHEAEASEAIAQSVEAESRIQGEIDEYIEKVGKTKTNSQLVVRCEVPENLGREYWKFEYKSNGEFKSKIEYFFLPTKEQYNAKIQIAKDMDGMRVVDKDEDMRMVAIKNDKANGQSFDKMYEAYTSEIMAENGYIVIE